MSSFIPPAKITHNPIEFNKNKLKNKYAFWFRINEDLYRTQAKQPLDKKEYENQVKKIAEFDTIEDFWAIFQHLRKPDSCKPGIEFQLFKEPVKPLWEDENNKNGGRMSLKLRKGYTTIIWEEMIFAMIGDVLPDNVKDAINGIIVTSRKEYNTLQIWINHFDVKIRGQIESCLRDLLQMPTEIGFEYKQFFRNKNNWNEKKNQ